MMDWGKSIILLLIVGTVGPSIGQIVTCNPENGLSTGQMDPCSADIVVQPTPALTDIEASSPVNQVTHNPIDEGTTDLVVYGNKAATTELPDDEEGKPILSKEAEDTIKTLADVGVKGVATLHSGFDTTATVNFIAALASAIPYGGTFAILLSGLFNIYHKKPPSDLEEVKNKLKDMNSKLDNIDQRIGDMLKKLENIIHADATLIIFKKKIDPLRKLKMLYERYTENPLKDTWASLQNECKIDNAIDFADWLLKEMTISTKLNMRDLMLQKYDITGFIGWTNDLTALLTDAMRLHVSCVGINNHTKAEIRNLLYGPNGKSGDLQKFRKSLKSVYVFMNQGLKTLKKDFFQAQAKQDIVDLMHNYQSMSNLEFCNMVFKQLNKKYPFREWMVSAWNPKDKDKYEELHQNQNSMLWINKYGRSVLAGYVMPDSSKYVPLNSEVVRCHNNLKNIPKNETILPYLRYYLFGCIGVKFDAFFVFKSNYVWGTWNTYVGSIQPDLVFREGRRDTKITILAVPDDWSHQLKIWPQGEICSATTQMCGNGLHCCPKSNKQRNLLLPTPKFVHFCCKDNERCGNDVCLPFFA